MTVKRNSIGHITRVRHNRDWRRTHELGASRMVERGTKTPESFGARMAAAVRKILGVQ